MKKVILMTSFFLANSSFAKATSYVCTALENPSKSALVAGEYFKMSVDENFGINANFHYPIIVESSYLGICEGNGEENTNPLAKGYAGMMSIGGAKCAADGFEIFASAGITSAKRSGLIQVDVGSEAVSYGCLKIGK